MADSGNPSFEHCKASTQTWAKRKNDKCLRIAYLVSHPIQYQAPLLRLLNEHPNIDLTVFFESQKALSEYYDSGFGRSVRWDIPLLEGYKYEFLPAIGRRDISGRLRPFNYGIVTRLWRGQFDALWIHGYARWFHWVAMAAAFIRQIPVLMRDEANDISAPRSAIKKILKRAFFAILNRSSDVFLAIGTLNFRYYTKNGIHPNRIVSMPYCIDNDRFSNLARTAAERRDEFRAELGLSPDRPVILFASKFMQRKRPSDLIRAYIQLLSSSKITPKPYLLFVGDGELADELKSLAKSHAESIFFLGFRNQSELPAFFELCDVFVLPSDSEPWGLVVNEAMSVGRAVIVSDQVGCGVDLVSSGVNGYVYPVGDITALADAIANVLQSRERIEAMGSASSQIIGAWSFQQDIDGLQASLAIIERSH